jgi:hypothetical protein
MEDTIPIPKAQEIDWGNMDEHFEKHFKQLGLMDKPKNDGSEFISKL